MSSNLLLIIVVTCILQLCVAGPSDLLPSVLLSLTPECALSCVISFAQEELYNCGDPTDLSCLCQARSANGYTIGEGSLACIADECPGSYLSTYSSIYQVCAYDINAEPMTHSTLTASLAVPTTILFQSGSLASTTSAQGVSASTFSTNNLSTSSSMSSQATATSQTGSDLNSSTVSTSSVSSSASASASLTGLVLDTTTPPVPLTSVAYTTPSFIQSFTPSITQAAASATSSSAAATPILATGQVAGIAVAGAVTAATALGLLVFIFCGRRLRERKARGTSGVPNDIVQEPRSDLEAARPAAATAGPEMLHEPFSPAAPPRSTRGPKANQLLGLPAAPNQHRQSWWNKFGKQARPMTPPPPLIGVARHLTPGGGGVSQDVSPTSVASYMTTSRLLPDKPAYPAFHEKKASNDTTRSQPMSMGGGVGLRVISATPEPDDQPSYRSYNIHHLQPNPQSRAPKKESSMEGSALKGKLSDPFLNKPHELQSARTHPSTIMFTNGRASRASLPKINTSDASASRKNLTSRPQLSQRTGVPNFRSLVQPSAHQQNSSHPAIQAQVVPQVPQVAPFSPLTPDVAGSTTKFDATSALDEPELIVNRGRPSPSPFFSSQLAQSSYRPYRTRSKQIRPETHYTTNSETDFEDDDPSPLSPPGPISIAELPALSPVAESPSSRATRENTKTPSPQIRGGPGEIDDRSTPLSRLRYPEIPGQAESPKREITFMPIAIGIPREARAVRLGRAAQGPVSPLTQREMQQANAMGDSAVSPLIELDAGQQPGIRPANKINERQQQGAPPTPLRSHLRTAKANDDLRKSAVDATPTTESLPLSSKFQAAQQAYLAPPSNSAAAQSINKFHHAAKRLSGLDTSSRLGNWPVQPVRPVRQAAPPQPYLQNSFQAQQPSQQEQRAPELLSPTSQLTFQQREQALREQHHREQAEVQATPSLTSPENAVYGDDSLRGIRTDSMGRVLLPGPGSRTMHDSTLLQSSEAPAGRPHVASRAAGFHAQQRARETGQERDVRRELQAARR